MGFLLGWGEHFWRAEQKAIENKVRPDSLYFLLIFLSCPEDIFIDFFFFRQWKVGGRKRERKGQTETLMCKTNTNQLPPICTPARGQTLNLGMCPDQELNPQPFGVRVMLQPTEPPVHVDLYFLKNTELMS